MPGEANAIKAIFLAALEKTSSAERAAYLDDACAQDPQVRERVEALLNAHDKPDRLLDHPAGQHLAPECDASALAFLEPSEKSGSIGRLGHYEVLEVLGHGGMGVVLRAFDEKLHRVVALKTLAPALASNGSARQRFAREARAAAAVTHENVIAIHAVEDAGPVPYLVMQCIDGETLQEKLDSTGPLELRAILRIGLQIAEGLAAAHRLGLIHRDIKPANILLEDSVERVRITDFGLARAADDVSLTQSGYIAGTPLYMSPEQARGEPVDHRTDLFSLGSVLYALCVGDPPFRAENSMAVLKRVCEDTPRSIRAVNPAIPSWLEQIVARLHAKSPASRFQTASEVAVLLSECLVVLQTGIATEKLIADTVAIGKPTAVEWAGPRRLPRTWAWMAVAIVMLTTLVAGSFFRGQRPSLPPDSGPVEPLTAPFVPAAAVQGQRRCAQQLQSSTLRTNSIGIQLALIPPGTFLMGSNEADIERHTSLNPGFWWNQFYGNELPCHRVTLSRPFYLGTTEVTVGQFRAFVDATGFKTEPETDGVGGLVGGKNDAQWNWQSPGFEQTDRHPVVQVTWNDATAFCRWLSEKEGLAYRLPTEAEWEWACRAGSIGDYCFGNDLSLLPRYANVYGGPTDRVTFMAGGRTANAWGLHDMHGNVFEWCADWFSPEYYAESPAVDPSGPPKGENRVQRSGYRYPGLIRSAVRVPTVPSVRENILGFRVACSVPTGSE